MKQADVTYFTDAPAEWVKEIDAAGNATELRAVLEEWKWIAPDALAACPTASNWELFSTGLAMERKGEFSGEIWAGIFAAILLPAEMMRVSMIAQRFGVPWGTAYLRLREAGRL